MPHSQSPARTLTRRSIGAAFAAIVAVAATAQAPSTAAAAPAPARGAWSPPVDAPVVRNFDPPAAAWGAGHLGVDYGVPPGTAVRAAADGTVSFAGNVAGALHVVVLHPDGLRTSYSFLSSATVRRGEAVARGDALGVSGGGGAGHGHDEVHFGLRAGERYLDPLLLFAPVDLAEVVRLVPAGGGADGVAPPGVELGGLLDGLGELVTGAGSAVVSAVGELIDEGGGAAARLLEALDGLEATLRPLAGAIAAGALRFPWLVEWLRDLDPVVLLPGLALDVGASLLAWARTLDECDPDAPPADGSGGSGHDVLVVAGINSATGAGGATTSLPTGLLGYSADEVAYYSYAADGGPYVSDDSHTSIEEAASRLADQLRGMHDQHPGRAVDLIAHSQGGVVALAFLELVYDPADPSYPPLGPVVTLSSPHEGAPLATAEVLVASSEAGRALLDRIPGDLVPPPSAESIRDLAEGSALLGRLEEAALPEGVEVTSIGAALDLVVPATSTGAEGAAAVVVNPWSLDAHSAIVTDPGALRAARAALEGRPLPCVEFGDALVGAVAPELISRAEHTAGLVAGAAGVAADVVLDG